MITLGIETSCDETAASLVRDGIVLSSEVSSSVHLHSKYGGVVPEIASRFHVEYISLVLEKTLEDAGVSLSDIDLVAVTGGPGLPGSLLVGKSFAEGVGFSVEVPVIEINHLRAHIFSSFLGTKEIGNMSSVFPFLGVVVSGGHTSIYQCDSIEDFSLIGRTRDDAAGEAFDKVAKIMALGYPGGPVIEKRSLVFDRNSAGVDEIAFPRALLKDRTNLDFSFSGIKTAVMYHWRDSDKTEREKNRICYFFQEAVVDVIVEKIKRAVKMTGFKTVALGGGVINNDLLRMKLDKMAKDMSLELYLPERRFCSDNAAMVAAYGEKVYLSKNMTVA